MNRILRGGVHGGQGHAGGGTARGYHRGSARCAAAAAPASAHNSLTGSDPREGARLAVAPTQVQLTFLSPLDPHTATITVTGPDSVSAEAGSPTFNGSKVAVPFRPGAAGLYHIGYQVASGDGHPVKGEVWFTLTVGATPNTAPAASPTPPVATPAPSVTPAVQAVPAASAGDRGSPVWPWALGGVLVLAVLSGAVVVLRRRSRVA